MAIKISGTTVIDDGRDINNVGIVTADTIHLTGGTFGPIDGGSDTKADTAIVVGENFHIYNLESSGGHLRNLIEKTSGDITIGESGTATIDKISLIPGKGDGCITELWAGNASASVGILTANASGVEVSGILTATTIKGPGTTDATFIGDGSGLSNVTGTGSGIVIRHDNTLVGTAATIDVSTNLDVTAVSAGVCTITASGSSMLEIMLFA